MNLLRRFVTDISILAVLVLGGSPCASARTGMFLIHGKGYKNLSDITAASDYWGRDMINAITNYETIPYALGHYDGTQEVVVAARTIGAQLAQFIQTQGISTLVVVAHSYGATVFREIVSRPNAYLYVPKPGDPPVEQWRLDITSQRHLIAERLRVAWLIGGPNGGSEAADLAYSNTPFRRGLFGIPAYFLGERTVATRDCTTRRMALLNAAFLHGTPGRPFLPRRWHPIIGTSALSDGSTASDYLLDGLATVSSMPTPNDGMVAEWSAGLVGTPFLLGNCGGTCNPAYFVFTAANHDHSRRYEPRYGYVDHRIAEYIAYFTFHDNLH